MSHLILYLITKISFINLVFYFKFCVIIISVLLFDEKNKIYLFYSIIKKDVALTKFFFFCMSNNYKLFKSGGLIKLKIDNTLNTLFSLNYQT